ncbi:MAG: hypothetical protein M3M85_01010 [bacterium]|nr:hypothetical protein [bacterium]
MNKKTFVVSTVAMLILVGVAGFYFGKESCRPTYCLPVEQVDVKKEAVDCVSKSPIKRVSFSEKTGEMWTFALVGRDIEFRIFERQVEPKSDRIFGAGQSHWLTSMARFNTNGIVLIGKESYAAKLFPTAQTRLLDVCRGGFLTSEDVS